MSKPNILYNPDKSSYVEILGKTGISYTTPTNRYFIDSELLVGSENDIAIFKSRVKDLKVVK